MTGPRRTGATGRRTLGRVLYDIAHVLESADASGERLRRVLELLRAAVPYDECVLLESRLGEQSRVLIEPEAPLGQEAELVCTLEELLASLIEKRAGERAGAPPARPDSSGTLAVPLVGHGEVIGILFVRRAEGAYAERHLRAVAIVGAQLAAYLSVVRAHEEGEAARSPGWPSAGPDRLGPVVSRVVAGSTQRSAPGAHVAVRLARTGVAVPVRAPGGAEPSAAVARPAARLLDGLRVLLVDDDQDVREALQAVLEHSGAAVTSVGSVAAALVALAGSRPDVLLSDLAMPGESGYDLMRQVAARDALLPAAALTAFGRIADRERALAAGFKMQLTKPIDADALVTAVADLAGRRPAGSTPPVHDLGEL